MLHDFQKNQTNTKEINEISAVVFRYENKWLACLFLSSIMCEMVIFFRPIFSSQRQDSSVGSYWLVVTGQQ